MRSKLFPSFLLPLYQNESSCETIHTKICSVLKFIFMIFMQIKLLLHETRLEAEAGDSEMSSGECLLMSLFTLFLINIRLVIGVYTLLISRGAILNIEFMTSFAESNLPSCALFTLDPCLIARHQMSSSKEESKKGQYLS